MAPDALMQVLHQLPVVTDDNLLVGPAGSDDAGVYKVSDDQAIILTMDFFPPIVDDAYTFGQIAAANALSDVYAMGGEPRLAMNVVCFPTELPIEVLNDIIRGSADKLAEAGTIIVGGHSIEDNEVKFGLSVTGFVHPDNVMTNAGAKVGDKLILTKPIGTGVVMSALKAGKITLDDAGETIASMTTLNKDAAALMAEGGVNACTDVTGFGLIGHALEMASAAGVSITIDSGKVLFFAHAEELVLKKKNRPKNIGSAIKLYSPRLSVPDTIDEARWLLLFDPQTSGGLLISVPDDKAKGLVTELSSKGHEAAIVGEVAAKNADWTIKVEK